MTMTHRKPRYLLCVKNAGYEASLERRKVYRALANSKAESHGLVRVLDESGEDYLYPADFFVAIELPKVSAATMFAGNTLSSGHDQRWGPPPTHREA